MSQVNLMKLWGGAGFASADTRLEQISQNIFYL